MGLFDNFRNWLLEPLLGRETVERIADVERRREYRKGEHKKPIKTADDVVVVNFIGLIVDRTVANLFGKEPKFDLPGESEDAVQVYIDDVWRANDKMKLLKTLALYGAESGTVYIKMLPDGAVDKQGNIVPRLVALDPTTVKMDTLPEDADTVIRYTIAYGIKDPVTGKDKFVKQVIEAQDGNWVIRDYISDSANKWSLTNEQVWEWDFAPILHAQNLPEPGSPYGRADITDDLIELQDRINFVSSNTAKIIKYHAHPKTWGRGNLSNSSKVQWGVDEMVMYADPNATIQNLEMQSDLGSSLNFMRYLRQALFDISRSVDLDSMADKLGSLTNFGLRVLYQDAMSKIEEKRGLYGSLLVEVNRRLLMLAELGDDGGEVIWADVLPVNEIERATAIRTDLELGLVSKQTASSKRGYVWEDEEERIADEATQADNIGAALLTAFGQGR